MRHAALAYWMNCGGRVGALSDWSTAQGMHGVHVWFRGAEGTSDFSIDEPPEQRGDPLFSDIPYWYNSVRGNTWLGERLFLVADAMPREDTHHAVYLKDGRRYLIAYRMHPGGRGRHADCWFYPLDAWLRLSDALNGPWRDALVWLWGPLEEHHLVETGSGISLFYTGYSAPEVTATWMRLHCGASEGDRLFFCVDSPNALHALAQSATGAAQARIAQQARLFAAIDHGMASFVKQRNHADCASWDDLFVKAVLLKKSAPVVMKSDSGRASIKERMADMVLAALGLSDREMWLALSQCGAHAALLNNLGGSLADGLDDWELLVMLYFYCESMRGDRGS
jgi:hypothetical protein